MRLIDADKLKERWTIASAEPYNTDAAEVLDSIDDTPTAYDIEKVVEQLEYIKMRHFLTMANTGDDNLDFAYEYVGNALDTAIEIVKGGAE